MKTFKRFTQYLGQKAMVQWTRLRNGLFLKTRQSLALNKGLGSIELIVLIMVLVGLALLFKDKIQDFLGNLTNQLDAADIMNDAKKH